MCTASTPLTPPPKKPEVAVSSSVEVMTVGVERWGWWEGLTATC